MADPKASPSSGQLTPFGHEMRKHFLFDEDYVNLNHGSFGTYPTPVRTRMHAFQDRAEACPDRFIRYEYGTHLDASRQALAALLHVPVETVVFVPNATTGINTVLRSLRFAKGDRIVYFSTIYGSCEKTIEYIAETTPAEGVKVEYTYPVSDDEMVRRFEGVLEREKKAGKTVRVAHFDTVASLPGVRMPFERLTEVCRREGVLSLIDGAHGVGHVPLDLGALQPDFFISNCHKWLFVPRGCAVFHVPLKNQALIRSSLPTSHGYEPYPVPGRAKINNPLPPITKSKFVGQFEFVGTIDNTPYLCIPEGLRFRQDVCGGEEKIMRYCMDVVKAGGVTVAKALQTEVLDNAEGSLTKCAFANVRLPLTVGDGQGEVREEDAGGATQWLVMTMLADHHTFMAVVFYGGAWWVRLSGQIYLEAKDFEWAAEVLKGLCERVRNGDHLKSKPRL